MSLAEPLSDPETTDVALVGAGPIGLELAVALQRAGLDYLHLEAHQIGHTISWYAPFTPFFSSPERIAIAGVPLVTVDQTKATREEYLTYLRAVAEQFDLPIRTYHRVASAQTLPSGGFRLTVESAHGVSKVHCRRLVLIVGGKNSAVEAAIRCCRVGARVLLSYHRKDLRPERIKFWLLPEIRAMIREERVSFLPETRIRAITPDRTLLAQGPDEEPLEVAADHVLLMTGYVQDPELYRQLGMELQGPGNKPRLDPGTMETDVPGLYLAGTGSAGTQLEGVKEFIETSHVHVERILDALQGKPPRGLEVPEFELTES